MKLSGIMGQPHAVRCLTGAITTGRIGQAYLFYGPPGVGKRTAALAFGTALNCESPLGPGEPCGICRPCKEMGMGIFRELRVVVPEGESGRGRSFHTQQISDAVNWAAKTVYAKRLKVCVMEDVHHLTGEAGNKFLKMLEEPPPRTVWLLLSTEPGGVLPTIRSRCQPVRFTLLPREAVAAIYHGQGKEKAEDAAAIVLGRVDRDPARVQEAMRDAAEMLALASRFDLPGLCARAREYGGKDRSKRQDALLDGLELACRARLLEDPGTLSLWIGALDAVARARWRLKQRFERTFLDALGAELALAMKEPSRA